ncbi:hypothetical protein ACP4OV_024027 [Aristida adscensionis]
MKMITLQKDMEGVKGLVATNDALTRTNASLTETLANL